MPQILTIQLVLRYFLDLDSQNFEVALPPVSNLMESPEEIFTKSVFKKCKYFHQGPGKYTGKISFFCVFCFLFNWLLSPRVTSFLAVFKCPFQSIAGTVTRKEEGKWKELSAYFQNSSYEQIFFNYIKCLLCGGLIIMLISEVKLHITLKLLISLACLLLPKVSKLAMLTCKQAHSSTNPIGYIKVYIFLWTVKSEQFSEN